MSCNINDITQKTSKLLTTWFIRNTCHFFYISHIKLFKWFNNLQHDSLQCCETIYIHKLELVNTLANLSVIQLLPLSRVYAGTCSQTIMSQIQFTAAVWIVHKISDGACDTKVQRNQNILKLVRTISPLASTH